MKTLTLCFALAIASFHLVFSQNHSNGIRYQGIKYQGVARNGLGELFSSQNISLRISIIDSFAGGTSVYAETQSVRTNEYGLFSIVIGEGQPLSGDFSSIPWSSGEKWLKVEMDPRGGTNFYLVGISELLSVPFSKVSETSLSDPDAENELIEAITFNTSARVLTVTEGENEHSVIINTQADDLSDNTLNDLKNVDASPTPGKVLKWNGTKWIAADDETNEQTLSINNNILTISEGNSVDLTPYLDNTDEQQLFYSPSTHMLLLQNGGQVSLAPIVAAGKNTAFEFDSVTNELTIVDGSGRLSVSLNGVLSHDRDSDPENEMQTLSLNAGTLSISGGNSVNLPDNSSTNEIQNLLLNGNTVSISGGNSITLDDNDDTNELNSSVNLNGATLEITDAGGTQSVDLSILKDDADANPANELQTLSLSGNTLSISNGNSVTLPDVNPTNELQNLSLNGDTIFISSGNHILLPTGFGDNQTLSLSGNALSIANGNSVSLSSFMDNTDSQTLSLSGNHLAISGGNSVTLPDASPSNEIQNLSLTGNTLSISDGNAVDLSSLDVDTDEQTLSVSGSNLSISNGNTVDLSSFLDNTDAQTLSLSGSSLSISGGNAITLPDASPSNELQDLSLTGNILTISGGTSVDLSSFADNTDAQTLSLVGNMVSISNGNSIDISSFMDNTDSQTLSLSGNNLSISNGNTIDLSRYLDNTDAQNLTLSGSTLSISGGNSVTLPDVSTTNEIQNLSLTGNTLSISSGNSVNLSSFLDNTDNQTLSFSNDTLRISNGNSIYFGGSNQTLSLSGNNLSISGGNTVAFNNVTFTGQTKLDGTFTFKIKTVDSNDDPYTAGDEILILADGSLGAMQVRLPQASTVPGRVYIIKKIDSSSFAITINPAGVETIDGVLTPTLSTQYQFIQVISNGSTWYTIGH